MTGPMPQHRVVAVLGPTNTGKTHFAVERMLGHSSGIIGLPLRLLAREVYDRVRAAKGDGQVALITGEEKIVPANPSYWVCTVESMPLDLEVAFLAVDEIQLCGDEERGHVFTDRLLRARGREETMFMGADTVRPLLRKLVPEAELINRSRFSTLSYSGPKKLSRLPRRSAIVAFTANDVYAIAELIRRRKGGAAVVMGALSPRTRNAQVAMYQNGEVDYIVATDAIGMGLNMSVNHVAFASLAKFDGTRHRRLGAAEIAQIAGRAGRHMNDGTFGLIADGYGDFAGSGAGLEAETIEAIEQHRFRPLSSLIWRNSDVDVSSIGALIRSLEVIPTTHGLRRAFEAEDLRVLKSLSQLDEITDIARGPAAVSLLWQSCQIPDFRKTMADEHARFAGRIYRHLMSQDGCLPDDWVAGQVSRLDRIDGDLDTLATRISYIRTWTYIANRPDWLQDPGHWRETTRAIEDKLSDALHEKLTQRFVDKRAAVLAKRLQANDALLATVDGKSDVLVEGHYVGRLEGLTFIADEESGGGDALLVAAASKALRREINRRIRRIRSAGDDQFTLTPDTGEIAFDGDVIARVAASHEPLLPGVEVVGSPFVEVSHRDIVAARIRAWLEAHLRRKLAPLYALDEALKQSNRNAGYMSAPARGLAFTLLENLGSVPRRGVTADLRKLEQPSRAELRRFGVRFGEASVFITALVKPEAARLRLMLWATSGGRANNRPLYPQAGLTSVAAAPAPDGFYEMAGFRVTGERAVRIDILERLAQVARKRCAEGTLRPDQELMSLLGCDSDAATEVLSALGYRPEATEGGEPIFIRKKRDRKIRPRKKRSSSKANTNTSPFAALEQLFESDGNFKKAI